MFNELLERTIDNVRELQRIAEDSGRLIVESNLIRIRHQLEDMYEELVDEFSSHNS